MSRALAPDERRESDSYMTEPKVARALVQLLVDRCHLLPGARVLEPSAGEGAFLPPLAELVPGVRLDANDIDRPGAREFAWRTAVAPVALCAFEGRFEEVQRLGPGIYDGYDAIVGNPPFSLAESHVKHALNLLAHGGTLAFLLRLAFLETEKRIPFWREHPASEIHVLAERPSFTGGRTDSTAYGFFVWKKSVVPHVVSTRVEVFSWGGRDPKPRVGRQRAPTVEQTELATAPETEAAT